MSLDEDSELLISARLHSPIAIEARGHYTWPEELECFEFMNRLDLMARRAIAAAYRANDGNPAALTEPVPLKPSYRSACGYCGANEWETDGLTVTAAHACELAHGIELSFEVDFPSGRVVVANDLRPEFDVGNEHDINTPIGLRLTIEDAAKAGYVFVFVGNSCPTVYSTGPDEYAVASYGYDPLSDCPTRVDGEEVARVITDLWWVTMADGDEFDKRYDGKQAPSDAQTLDVTAGTYVWDYYRLLKAWSADDYYRPSVYAKAKLKG